MAERAFDKEGLIEAFNRLGRRAYEAGKVVEISVYGGSALTLTFDWRMPTKDVDAVFEADKAFVRQLTREIALENGWPDNWLNDGVKGFLSRNDAEPSSKTLFGTFPSDNEPGLRVMVATPTYLFAMKCRAMRIGGVDENADIDDIRRLALELGILSVTDALNVVSAFYPARQLPSKTQFGLEEIFDTLNSAALSSAKGSKP